jgi:hypothetical protein
MNDKHGTLVLAIVLIVLYIFFRKDLSEWLKASKGNNVISIDGTLVPSNSSSCCGCGTSNAASGAMSQMFGDVTPYSSRKVVNINALSGRYIEEVS